MLMRMRGGLLVPLEGNMGAEEQEGLKKSCIRANTTWRCQKKMEFGVGDVVLRLRGVRLRGV